MLMRRLVRFLRRSRQSGQGASEVMLTISVVSVGVLAGAYTFAPGFRAGVNNLASDVHVMLAEHSVTATGSGAAPAVGSSTGQTGAPASGSSSTSGAGMGDVSTSPSVATDGTLTDVNDNGQITAAAMMMMAALFVGLAMWSYRRGNISQQEMQQIADQYVASGGDTSLLGDAYQQASSDPYGTAETLKHGGQAHKVDAVYRGDSPFGNGGTNGPVSA